MTPDPATSCLRPAGCDLQWWITRAWQDGIEVTTLAPLDQLVVRTRNTTYEFTVLNPVTGDVLVCGGTYFPIRADAQLAGCSLGGAFLKVRSICVGFRMELLHAGRRIVTSPVQEIGSLSPRPM